MILDVNFTQISSAIPPSSANSSYVNAIAIGYLNSDSIIDLATVYRFSSNLVVWMGTGNGTFIGGTSYTTSFKPYDLSIIDLNGDNQLDIIIICFGASELNLFINQGSGIFVRKLVKYLICILLQFNNFFRRYLIPQAVYHIL